jgi:hypothetical protein
MHNIEKYFEGEKLQCIAGIIISVVCISGSVYLLLLHNSFLKGIAYSFFPLSVFLLVICAGIVIRTPEDIERISGFWKTEPQKMQTEELPRMEKVMKNFSVIKKVEIYLLAAGLLAALFFWKNDLVKGIATGIMIQSVILYVFDYTAAIRGKIYVEFLNSL